MIKIYTLISCLSIAAVFLVLPDFKEGETKLLMQNNHSPVSRERKPIVSTKLASEDNMVAAILIMPKYYLPALKRFSQSKMAKNIKILQAQLELKNGEMTAIHKTHNEIKRDRVIMPDNSDPNKTKEAKLERRSKKEKQILAAGILYLMANAHKSRLYH